MPGSCPGIPGTGIILPGFRKVGSCRRCWLISLSVLDEHFDAKWKVLGLYWKRSKHHRSGWAVRRIVRYADDSVVMVHRTRADVEALWEEVAAVLAPMGLHLSVDKSRVCHIDEWFDFLGFRIQRQVKRGTTKRYVYTWPSKKALKSIVDKVRDLTRRCRHRTLADLLHQLNYVLRGWCNYFPHGVSKCIFSYVDHVTWWRVVGWMRKRHLGLNWGTFCHRFLPGWQIRDGRTAMFRPYTVEVTRYRYRGAKSPTPWTVRQPEPTAAVA